MSARGWRRMAAVMFALAAFQGVCVVGLVATGGPAASAVLFSALTVLWAVNGVSYLARARALDGAS